MRFGTAERTTDRPTPPWRNGVVRDDGREARRPPRSAAVRRLDDDGERWRVVVESWAEPDGFGGRLVFERDDPAAAGPARQGPPLLHGRSREEVFSAAHELPERRMRELLRSLR